MTLSWPDHYNPVMDIGAPAIDRLRHTKKGVGLSLSLSADSGAAFKVYEDATDKFSLMVPQGKSSGQLGFSFSFFLSRWASNLWNVNSTTLWIISELKLHFITALWI